MFTRSCLLLCALALLVACPSKDSGGGDGGNPDAGLGDAGQPDAGGPFVTFQLQTRAGGSFGGVNAAWIAARSGDGGWMTPQGEHGIYLIPVTDAASPFVIAERCPSDFGSPIVQVFEGTQAEWPSITATACPPDPDGGVALAVSYSNVNASGTQVCGLTLGEYMGSVSCAGAPAALTLTPGSYDLLGSVRTNTFNGSTLVRAIVERDVSVTTAATHSVDFNDAFTPSGITLSAANPGSDTEFMGVSSLQLSRSPASWPGLSYFSEQSGTVQVLGVSRLAGDELNILTMSGYSAGGLSRTTTRAVRSPADFAATLPDHLTFANLSNAGTGGAVRVQYAFAGGPPSAWVLVVMTQGAKQLAAFVSPGLAAGTHTLPDLSGAPGFDSAWSLQPGLNTGWTFYAGGGNRSLDLNQQMFFGHTGVLDGAEIRYASTTGHLTP